MADCEVPYIDCANKDITIEELLKLMAVKLPDGSPALRTCGCGCGGDVPASNMPIGNSVFVNPLGDDATGERENFHKPFLTLNSAKLAASPFLVNGGFIVANGTGYPAPAPQLDVPTTGGTGVGLTVDYEESFPGFISVTINTPGTGYTNGDIVTITGGNEDRTLQLNVAQVIDTIYVYGGTYNEGNVLHKEGVKWHFLGKPTLNLFAPSVWNDDAGITDIQINGDAIINHFGNGNFIRVNNFSTVSINFHKVTGIGSAILWLGNGSGIINIATKLEVTTVNRCIQFEEDNRFVINVDDIFCNSFIGGVSNAVNCRGNHIGQSIINARIIRLERANGQTVAASPTAQGLGVITFNISDKISFDRATTIPIQGDGAVALLGGTFIINGNIDGKIGHAIDIQTGSSPKYLEHNGNAINDGSLPLVYHGADSGFWSAGNSTLKLNGKYKSSNEKVVQNGGLANGQKMFINGEIISEYNGIVTNYGLYLEADAGATLLDNVKIVMDLVATNPRGIGAGGPRDIKIVHNVASNADVDGNITNLITGTQYVFDTDIE